MGEQGRGSSSPRSAGPARRLFRLGIGRPRPEDEVNWEVQHYLDEVTERLVGEGWEEGEARAGPCDPA